MYANRTQRVSGIRSQISVDRLTNARRSKQNACPRNRRCSRETEFHLFRRLHRTARPSLYTRSLARATRRNPTYATFARARANGEYDYGRVVGSSRFIYRVGFTAVGGKSLFRLDMYRPPRSAPGTSILSKTAQEENIRCADEILASPRSSHL